MVLGGPPRRDLLALTGLAARVIGVPMATINPLTGEHQVSAVGFGAGTSTRTSAMCDHVVRENRPILLEDAVKLARGTAG